MIDNWAEENVFDREKLRQFVQRLPQEFILKDMDEELFHWSQKQEWSRDLVAQYESYEQYRKIGLGVMVLKNGIAVAGASSYSSYRNGIEIEIDTYMVRCIGRKIGVSF